MIAVQAFKEAILAVSPFRCVHQVLSITPDALHITLSFGSSSFPLKTSSKVVVVAFGKASLAMVAAAESALGSRFHRGIVLAPVDSSNEFEIKSQIFFGAKDNLPDESSVFGTNQILSFIEESDRADDIILFLISGGGSALFCGPEGVTLQEKLETIRILVSYGATIQQLNTIRQRLSKVKGGKTLARIHKAQVISLLMSDIIDDPVNLIASGPTVFPKKTKDPLEILESLHISLKLLPQNVIQKLQMQEKNHAFPMENHFIVANNTLALAVSKNFLEKSGFSTHLVSSSLSGDAALRGQQFARLLSSKKTELPAVLNEIVPGYSFSGSSQRIAFIFGGETTTLNRTGSGKGGRCQHMALQCLHSLKGLQRSAHKFSFLAAGTDGQDGPTSAAGVVISENDSAELNSIETSLENFNSFDFWNDYNNGASLIVTGKTGTNVMDICIVLLEYE